MANIVQIRDLDKGYRKLVAEIGRRGSYVEIGVLGPRAMTAKGVPPPAARDPKKKGKRPPRRPAGAPSGPRPTVADVATWNELGTDTIPARPFIGGWFDTFRLENRQFARELAAQRMLGKLTYDRSLQLMGARAKGGIQKYIAAGLSPPNAASTIRRKKSSKPLIHTGQLRSSVDFRIVTSVLGGSK